jgi:hypothetical protein
MHSPDAAGCRIASLRGALLSVSCAASKKKRDRGVASEGKMAAGKHHCRASGGLRAAPRLSLEDLAGAFRRDGGTGYRSESFAPGGGAVVRPPPEPGHRLVAELWVAAGALQVSQDGTDCSDRGEINPGCWPDARMRPNCARADRPWAPPATRSPPPQRPNAPLRPSGGAARRSAHGRPGSERRGATAARGWSGLAAAARCATAPSPSGRCRSASGGPSFTSRLGAAADRGPVPLRSMLRS